MKFNSTECNSVILGANNRNSCYQLELISWKQYSWRKTYTNCAQHEYELAILWPGKKKRKDAKVMYFCRNREVSVMQNIDEMTFGLLCADTQV